MRTILANQVKDKANLLATFKVSLKTLVNPLDNLLCDLMLDTRATRRTFLSAAPN